MESPWDRLGNLILIMLLLFANADGFQIEAGPDILSLTQNGDNGYIMYMNENNHNFSDSTLLLTFTEVSDSTTLTVAALGSATFMNNLTKVDSGTYQFYATQFFDYETQATVYIYGFLFTTDFITVTLNIVNIDDESPSLTSPTCSFKENFIYDKDNSTCNCTLSDPDGWLNRTTFTIDSATDYEKRIFSFQYRTEPTDDLKETLVYVVLNETLDYEELTFHSFNVIAKDSAGHGTTPEAVRVLVNVIDQNDMPPEWTNYFTTTQFEEEQEMTFQVIAVDGNKGINAEISYKVVSDEPEERVSINSNTGEITVLPIDRDARDIQTYVFTIMAYQTETPSMNISLTITFYIEDIDDNSPLIGSISDLSGDNNVTFNEDDTKIAPFNFDENFDGTLDVLIAIRDIDTGENAQFSVQLEELEDSEVEYTSAFLISPTAGYRSGSFQISVRNSTKLDYEDPPWINIKFNVLSKGTKNETKQDRMLVNITLNDINDEWPIFPVTEYSVEIKETLGIDEFIIEVLATDRDAEDKILNHSLVGSQVITKLLKIDSPTGNIYVAEENAFDYDRINPVFVQVRATDAVGHTATVPLTINLLDVNNKAPTITVTTTIEVDENQVTGSVLNTSITAADQDTTRDLVAEIDWDGSYAMKNSRRLDMTNETIRQQVEFLNLAYEKTGDNGDITISLIVNDNNPTSTTPDFELFDSLFLNIRVTDLNADPDFLDKQNTTALILIGIGDLNDNPPIFTEETVSANRTVYENARQGDIVGSLIATDADVGDTVTYDCSADDENFDWLVIDSHSGVFTVKDNNLVDADTPKTFTFNYTCSASDDNQTHTTYLNVSIYILDTNNKVPSIEIDSTVSVKEKSAEGTIVSSIGTTDLDRDIPFYTVQCEWQDRTSVCRTMFNIVDNTITVGSNTLDRDLGDKSYTCTILCYDNPDELQNNGQNQNTATVVIELEDINDHPPELLTTTLSGTENYKEGDLIGIILATDIDEGDNAEIDFSISAISKEDDKDTDYTGLFKVDVDDEYRVNDTFKQANLFANKDLKGLYGTYTLTLYLADRGTPPNSSYYDLNLEIDRFNYYAPRFIFPTAEGESYILQAYQEIGSQLYQFFNNSLFPDITATDNEEDVCTDKWNMTFNVEQIEPNDTSIFTINSNGFAKCTCALQVNSNYNKDAAMANSYKLNIIASIKDGEPEEGEEAYSTTTSISLNFHDSTQDPIFLNNTWEFSFLEANVTQQQPLEQRAVYQNIPDSDQISIYYFLVQNNDTIAKIFDVSIDNGTVSLKQELDYLTDKDFQFQILASKNTEASTNNQMSYLSVTVNVIDINNHAPQWTEDHFYGAIMSSYPRNTPILSATATDADEIDKDNLTYEIIEDSLEKNGTGLDNIVAPFIMDTITGEIKLNFTVDNIMQGSFKFNITVQDKVDDYGNGPFHNITDVTIFIITSDNTVNFRFENTLTQVVNREQTMLEKIGNILGYGCYKQNIAKDSEEGVELDNQTVASLYFLNSSELVKSDVILRQVSNINTFTNLKSTLLEDGLLLMSFATDVETENLEQLMRTWLIGVSVVLGVICIILLVTFILKSRELNRRIKSLTTKKFGSEESGLNRLGINAPTTNKHAVEGSNPVFNTNIMRNDFENYDKTSIRSGDSDLVGVEDNPEFDYYNNKINEKY